MARPLIVSLLAVLLFVPTSVAETRTATDRSAGVRFRLAGQVLTARLVPQADRVPRDARRELWAGGFAPCAPPAFARGAAAGPYGVHAPGRAGE